MDILATIEKSISLLDMAEARLHLEELLGMKVDLVASRSVRPELRERILAEAVPV